MAKSRFDEGDVRIRPPRSTRPRTKNRPDYSDATQAFVTTVDRGRITCITDDGTTVTAMKARELGKNAIVSGDRISIVGDTSGREGTLARAVAVLPRRNSLARTVDDAGAFEKIIASNIDQMIIVAAAANPEPRHGFIDRCLVVAYDQKITPVIVITKCDLANPEEFLKPYRALDVVSIVTQRGADLEELRTILHGKVSVLIGHSGVGKSTLFNALLGVEARAVGKVNDATGRGRHTSSSAYAVSLDDQSWVIDTPGVRSFGLEHVDQSRVVEAFADLSDVIAHCPKNCSHNEAECALHDFIDAHPERRLRVESLQRLLTARVQPLP